MENNVNNNNDIYPTMRAAGKPPVIRDRDKSHSLALPDPGRLEGHIQAIAFSRFEGWPGIFDQRHCMVPVPLGIHALR